MEAITHFEQMRRGANVRWLWSLLTRTHRGLFRLADLGPQASSGARRLPDVQQIPLARIVGTDNRPNDFDRGFAPTRDQMRERWLGVALARVQGRRLPPVELVQAGDDYYVVDGHHRVSVALAYGEDTIEAYVVAYTQASARPSPCTVPATA